MRRIENMMMAVVKEFRTLSDKRKWSCGNTIVSKDDSLIHVYLHGHEIYRENITDGRMVFSLAGWPTPTTRSRLRALGVLVYQDKHRQMYRGKEIPCDEFIPVLHTKGV